MLCRSAHRIYVRVVVGGRRADRRTLYRAPDRVAGVAHNKTLAKLCSGRRKPNQQVRVPWSVGNGSLVVLNARVRVRRPLRRRSCRSAPCWILCATCR